MILDENVGKRMQAIFLDDFTSAEDFTLARLRQRSWAQRIHEHAASLIQRLL